VWCVEQTGASANTTRKLTEDGVLTPKHVGINQYRFTILIYAYVGI